MTRIELQKEKASIITKLLLIDDAELIHTIKELVSKKTKKTVSFSPAALTLDELTQTLAEQTEQPNYLPHEEVVRQLDSRWS